MSFITIKISKLKYSLKQYSSISSAIDKSPTGKHLNKNMSTTSKHRFQTLKLLDGCIQMLPSNKYYVDCTSIKVLKFVLKTIFYVSQRLNYVVFVLVHSLTRQSTRKVSQLTNRLVQKVTNRLAHKGTKIT